MLGDFRIEFRLFDFFLINILGIFKLGLINNRN